MAQPIVIIEDSDADYKAVARAFARADVDVPLTRYKNGQVALDNLLAEEAKVPCLVVLDLHLPDVSGQEVIQTLRGAAHLSEMPVIVLTTSEETKDIEECYRLGVSSYIVKPMDFDGFVEIAKSISLALSKGGLLHQELSVARKAVGA